MNDTTVEILLVEDNADEAGLAIRALRKQNLANHLKHARDGAEALDYLFSSNATQLPKLILLDLQMPKVNGLEVLERIKTDERRKVIPVVIFTSSKEERDVAESYRLGVNAYVVKPVEFDNYTRTMMDLTTFWLTLNQPPV